jgi:hypothetical protein
MGQNRVAAIPMKIGEQREWRSRNECCTKIERKTDGSFGFLALLIIKFGNFKKIGLSGLSFWNILF